MSQETVQDQIAELQDFIARMGFDENDEGCQEYLDANLPVDDDSDEVLRLLTVIEYWKNAKNVEAVRDGIAELQDVIDRMGFDENDPGCQEYIARVMRDDADLMWNELDTEFQRLQMVLEYFGHFVYNLEAMGECKGYDEYDAEGDR